MAPLSTRVTATLANASERRSITFEYQQTPIYHTPVTVEVPLDEKGGLAVELPFAEAQMASVDLGDEVKLFLEPGDQLHIDADLLDLPQSLRFSGQGAANNQFLAALRSRFPDYLRIDYEDLAVDAFRKMIDQRRSELESFLDEGCSQYQLTPAFVAYYRAEITYEWANAIVSDYPINYKMQNRGKRLYLPADYYDVLDQVELIDEAAISTTHYRDFLWENFFCIADEAEERAEREQLSEKERRGGIQPHTIAYLPDFIVRLDEEQRRNLIQPHTITYHLAKRLLHGKVLYFFLAGEIIDDFQRGRFDQGDQRLAEFIQDNPYPEYTEVLEEVVPETSKFKPGRPAPDFTLDDLQGPKRLPERFQRPSGFPRFLVERVPPVHRRFSLSGTDQTADPRPEGRLPEHLLGLRRCVAPSGGGVRPDRRPRPLPGRLAGRGGSIVPYPEHTLLSPSGSRWPDRWPC